MREHIFADRWKNRKISLGTRTNFVPHRSSFPLNISFLDPYSNLFFRFFVFVALLGFLDSSDDLFSAFLPSECLSPTGKYSLISYCISIKLHDSALGFSTEAECNVAEIAAISTPRFLPNHLCLGHLIRQAVVNMF